MGIQSLVTTGAMRNEKQIKESAWVPWFPAGIRALYCDLKGRLPGAGPFGRVATSQQTSPEGTKQVVILGSTRLPAAPS